MLPILDTYYLIMHCVTQTKYDVTIFKLHYPSQANLAKILLLLHETCTMLFDSWKLIYFIVILPKIFIL